MRAVISSQRNAPMLRAPLSTKTATRSGLSSADPGPSTNPGPAHPANAAIATAKMPAHFRNFLLLVISSVPFSLRLRCLYFNSSSIFAWMREHRYCAKPQASTKLPLEATLAVVLYGVEGGSGAAADALVAHGRQLQEIHHGLGAATCVRKAQREVEERVVV